MNEFTIDDILSQWGESSLESLVMEALRDYVGDGEGADQMVLEGLKQEVAAKALRDAADKYEAGVFIDSIPKWLRDLAIDHLDCAKKS